MSLRAAGNSYENFTVTFPREKVVLVTLNRPQKLNCIDTTTSKEIAKIWEQFDEDESLWVGIITGNGRAFCTGADLAGMYLWLAKIEQIIDCRFVIEWNEMNRNGVVNDMSAPGLAGLPRRAGKKPIIAAVNGITMGGGFEMVANCDLVVASTSAMFALPEAKRGIVPVAGCLPRLTRTLGLQRCTDLALTGRSVDARTLYEWGLVTRLVDAPADVVDAAVKVADEMCSNSPDSLIVGRKGIRLSWESGNAEQAVTALAEQWYPRLVEGANFAEGIRAFAEKRSPQWINSKL